MTAIGIDLGTTNSVVTKGDADPSQVALIPVGGRRSTPSVVGMRESGGKPDVGAPALNFARRDATNTILSVKRLMGRDFADPEVAKTQQRRSYQVVPGSDTDPRAHVVMFGRKYTPAEISTLILRRLKEGAEQKLRTEVTHAVITVPAYFHETQRAATREAGEQAGLVVKRIIDEPTAAAVAFGLELQQDQRHRILVYDFGGGTFDISILNAVKDTEGHNHFQVLAYTGDNWLGGDDFDQLIVTRIIKWVKENAGLDPSSDPEFLFHAKQAAEDAKCQLSEAVEHDIIIPAAVRGPAGYVDVDMKLTRHDFEALITPSVDRTIDLVRKALDEQNQKPDDISDVLLVGGSTMIPKVYQAVEAFFGREKVRRSVDPMECVAIGAGILAGTLHGVQCQSCKTVNDESAEKCTQCGQSLVSAPSAGETHVYDVTGMSLGVAAVKGNRTDVFVPIIPKNTPYPMSEPMRQTFEATSGRLIRVPVYEGDSPVASQNQEQGVIEYELDEEIDIHTRVEVAFLFNRNRELRVTISVPGTNLTHQRELRVDTPRTQPPASEAADEDTTHREELVNVDWAAQRFLEGFEQYLKPEQAMRIRNHRQEAQQVLVFSEPAECRRVTSLLENDILGSGLASELYLAERAEERATREERPQITAAIAAVRKSFQDGNHAAAREQAVVLKAMVARVLVRNNVPVLEDGESYDGLLKLLDKSQP